jgi:hypothetical protein
LERAADALVVARHVTKAIIDGREAMSLIDKLDLVVTRRQDLNKSLDAGADAVLERYAQVEAKSEKAFDKHHARLDAEETAIEKTDQAIERMSNAAGNSEGSERSSEPRKAANGAATEQSISTSPMQVSSQNEGGTT